MPFVPFQYHLPLTPTGAVPTSVLTAEQQKRYVAIITNYLRPDSDFRFELNKYEIQVRLLQRFYLIFRVLMNCWLESENFFKRNV